MSIINRHTVKEFKKDLDVLIKNSERLAFLLDAIQNKEYELITVCDGGGHRTVTIEEIESVLQQV
ncbi:hypothetical protein [Pseudomonas sp.]|mgnify:FL=1|uniref:hypothetical protein n=1 Tax=Pseudomonas sp. TaxID=306 RepID=UPI003FD73179